MKDLQDLCVEIHKTLLRKIKDDTNRQTNEVQGTQGSPLLHLLKLSCTLKATLRKALRGFLHGFLGETDKANPKTDSRAANWGEPNTLKW